MENRLTDIISGIKLAILRALLGAVIPSLRAIAFEWDNEKEFVCLYFYHHGVITDAIEDHYSCIDSEASCDFFYEERLFGHDFKMIRLDYPKKLPEHAFWAYHQREPFIDPQ